MKRLIGCLLFAMLAFGMISMQSTAQEQYELNTWEAPEEYGNSTTFKVEVKKSGDLNWRELFVYNVKTGTQEAGERVSSSMVNFDFSGTVTVRITYKKGTVEAYDIRPSYLGIEAVQEGNTLTFSMAQDSDTPKKLVLRINDSWDSECLHIVTNRIEQDKPSEEADNVYVIEPGDEIPLHLPMGKDTYYFKEGIHDLPGGLWLELDLQKIVTVDRFEIMQGDFLGNTYAQRFILEGKRTSDDIYELLYDGTGNRELNVIQGNLQEPEVRYIRLRLLGNNSPNGWRFSNTIKELKIFDAQTGTNVAKGKATGGAMPNYEKAVDDDASTSFASKYGYGNAHSQETFFLSEGNTTVYMEAGAIVRGAIGAEGISSLTIRGRGILDSSVLDHEIVDFGEARTGSIWLNDGADNSIEGITVLDPAMWTVVMNYSNHPSVKGIHIFGSTMNADGIHLSGSNYGVIDGVFIRTCDDNIVMYHYADTAHNTIRNSVFWADEAHVFLIGLGTGQDSDISDISISNIDVLNQQGVYDLDKFNGVFKLWANGENKISDIGIEDVRIDPFKDPSKSCIFQLRTDERFAGEKNGRIENVTFNNIVYYGEGEKESVLLGADSEHTIHNVSITNYFRKGKKAENIENANVGTAKNFSAFYIEGKEVILQDDSMGPVTYLEEGFEAGQAGEIPEGWLCSAGITIRDSEDQNKSVQVNKGVDEESRAMKDLGSIDGIVTVKSKIYICDKNNWKSLGVKNAAGEELIQVGFDSGGNIYSCEGTQYTPFMTYNRNQWYDIQIVIDTGTDRYDLYMDDVLVRKSFPLVRDTEEVGYIEFASGEEAAGVFYFDDVLVVKSSVVLENDFNQENAGSVPEGWDSGAGIAVMDFPGEGNRSVKVEKGTGSAVSAGKQLPQSSGVFEIEAKMYMEDKANWKSLLVRDIFGKELVQAGFDSGGNIYSYNGTNYAPFMDYNTGQWYEVRLIINTNADIFDLYINGNLVNKGTVLVNSAESLGKIEFTSGEEPAGTYYFDDVRIVNLF